MLIYIGTTVLEYRMKTKFAKVMGIGAMIIGGSIAFTSILQLIFDMEILWWIAVIGIIIGIFYMVYGLIKYNGGIF